MGVHIYETWFKTRWASIFILALANSIAHAILCKVASFIVNSSVYAIKSFKFFRKKGYILPEHIYNPITAMGFSAMFIFQLDNTLRGFICTFSLLISLSITLWTSKFRNQFTISSIYFDMACYLKRETYSGPISFEVQRNDIWTDNIQSFEIPF